MRQNLYERARFNRATGKRLRAPLQQWRWLTVDDMESAARKHLQEVQQVSLPSIIMPFGMREYSLPDCAVRAHTTR